MEIQTSDTPGPEPMPKVFLSLEGDQGTKEMCLADPSAINDWERGDLNTGTFQTTELGNLIRGTLRHDGSGAGIGLDGGSCYSSARRYWPCVGVWVQRDPESQDSLTACVSSSAGGLRPKPTRRPEAESAVWESHRPW